MRIAFDLDDTLIPAREAFPTEPGSLAARLVTTERLRAGARELLRELATGGHEVWIDTTSHRAAWRLALWFRLLGVRLAGVIGPREHAHARHPASKYPPAFGIDLLVDESPGVAFEGERYGFRVVRVEPSDPDWTDAVRRAVG